MSPIITSPSWTASEDALLTQLWRPGPSGAYPTDKQLAADIPGRSASAIGSRRRLLRLISNFGRRWTEAEIELCGVLRKAGLTDQEISNKTGRSVETIRERLDAKSGVTATPFLHLSDTRAQRIYAQIACEQHRLDLWRAIAPGTCQGEAREIYRARFELDLPPSDGLPARYLPDATHVPTMSSAAA